MNTKIPTLVIAALLAVTATAAPASAQDNQQWHGQDSEFGSIRAPYSAEMDGARVPVEAQVVLRKNYEEHDSRFFMFAWTVENTPLDVEFTNLVRADTGEELECYQRQGESTNQIKCFVDLKNMPPAGTEIIMRGTVGSDRAGSFQVGAIVVPFTYKWERVPMSNGLHAELYGYTIVNVITPSEGGKTIAGLGNKVPGVGAVGAIGAVAVVAIGLAALRRR